jgi:eukaryotic-like serine/threonine-protein kinase
MTTRYCNRCRSANSDTARFCMNCGTPISDPGEDATATLDQPGELLAPGLTFAGRYLIIEELGRGGMGRIYRAIDKLIEDEIALKLISPEIAADRRTLEQFGRELKIARRIVHKNVVRMHDLSEDRGIHFITMEYVPGQDLKGLMRQAGRLTVAKTLFLAGQVCRGLAEAHRLGIVHRDLKPGNIMIDREGNARIMDFGLALSFAADQSGEVGLAGTPAYMSPEQLDGREVDPRADIYALGVILYEMLTGRRPFMGETPADIIAKHSGEPPPDPAALNPQIPVSLARLILRCLKDDRDERFPDAKALLAGMEEVETELPPETRTGGGPAAEAGKKRARKRWAAGVVAAFLLLAAAAAAMFLMGRRDRIESIAVLPFETAASGADAEFLSEGITEGVISRLTLLPSLKKVTALSSVFRYRGRTVDPQDAGRELGVDAVLVNRLIRSGEESRLLVELMRVRDNARIWGDQYPYKAADVFSVQEEIANSIADELRLNLTGEERRRVARSYTASYDAFYAYIQGRYFWSKRTAADLQTAITHFERAVQIDPNYALAYAGLSYVYCILPDYGTVPPNEAYPKARENALRALQIDEKLAQARLALAQIYRRYDWNWAAARAEYELAIKYDPNDAQAHHWYGYDLMCIGRFDEAIKEILRARDLDPFSPVINRNLGQALFRAGRYDEALKILHETLASAPTFSFLHFYIGETYLSLGRFHEALQEFEAEAEIQKGLVPRVDVWIGIAYFKLGRPDMTRTLLEALLERRKQSYVSPTILAILHFLLGRTDEGFRLLDEACDEHDGEILLMRIEPAFDIVRSDPRFAAILKRVGLDA